MVMGRYEIKNGSISNDDNDDIVLELSELQKCFGTNASIFTKTTSMLFIKRSNIYSGFQAKLKEK